MKFNFKKIASVLTSVAMLGSTIGIAAAANYPAPFVVGGTGNVALVYGSGAAFSDSLAAGEIKTSLESGLSAGGGSGGAGTVEGESVKIEKSSDKLNLNNGLTDVWGTALTKSDLPTILADGSFYNKQNTEYKYTQKIDLANLSFGVFSDSDYKDRVPTLGFKLNANSVVANYTLNFVTSPEATHGTDLTDFENKNIKILGKDYYILDFKNSTTKITLLDAASSLTLNEGDTQQITIGDKPYDVSIDFISDDQVVLRVNDEPTDKMSATGTTYGNTYKLSDGTYVGVKNINVQNYAGGSKSVEFSLGSGKLEITNSTNVKINDKTIDDLYGYISLGAGTSSKRTWQKLELKWIIDDEAFLTPGQELVMPGFGAFKFTMDESTFPGKEVTKLDYSSSDVIELKTTIKDGDVTLPLVYIDTTGGNLSGIGKSATQKIASTSGSFLVYNATSGSASQYDGFIASWASTREAESYYLEASVRYDSDAVRNLTTIKNKVTGTTVCEDVDPANSGTCTIGNLVLTVNNVSYVSGGDRLVTMTVNSGGSFSTLYTKEGMKIWIPVSNTSTINLSSGAAGTPTYASDAAACAAVAHITKGHMLLGNVFYVKTTTFQNYSGKCANYVQWMSEEDKDGTLGQKDFSLNVTTSGTSSYKVTVSGVNGVQTGYETASSSKIWEYYVPSNLATRILNDKTNSDQYSAEIEYHGGEVYANVYVAEPSAIVVAPNGDDNAVSLGDVIVTDAEVESVKTKNLIVVGGSCINTVAARVLGKTAPVCGEEFTTLTGVAANQALIKVVTSPYSTSNVAMLIAGYNADDTTKAAKYVTTETISTTAGTTKKLSTSSTVATVLA